jgi:hypothetical protein
VEHVGKSGRLDQRRLRRSGFPIGVQIIGRRFDDLGVLRLTLLIGSDGAVVLSDPGAVWDGRPPPQDQVALIDLLLSAAQAKVGRR